MKYKCPNCGKIINHDEYILDIGDGSVSGMCYCEFEEFRILNPFIKIENNIITNSKLYD